MKTERHAENLLDTIVKIQQSDSRIKSDLIIAEIKKELIRQQEIGSMIKSTKVITKKALLRCYDTVYLGGWTSEYLKLTKG